MHAVVARSTFSSQSVKNWQIQGTFGRRDVEICARCSGAKHISKSKGFKTGGFRALFEVEMLKKCTCCGAKHMSKEHS